MSFGPSGAVHMQVQKNAAGSGIFWQKERQKLEPKKFGYKTKKLRVPLRRPDEQRALEEMEALKELEKKRFNKGNKDFIRRNQDRLKKDLGNQPNKGSTEIKPGTVTLTQAQLTALLASLGKTKGGESPLRISVDASTNKLEIEKYESDDDDDVDIEKHENYDNDDDDDDDQSHVGIAALLGKEKTVEKSSKQKKNHQRNEMSENRAQDKSPTRDTREEQRQQSRRGPKPDMSRSGPSRHLPAPDSQSESRLSWEVAKKEAGLENLPDTVPWKHLTVGERKRLQWARERAEVAEAYDPWGRPGAGAPPQKAEQVNPSHNDDNNNNSNNNTDKSSTTKAANSHGEQKQRPVNIDADTRRKQEKLTEEIEKLRKEIREAEEKKVVEEHRMERARKEQKKQKEEERKEDGKKNADKRGVRQDEKNKSDHREPRARVRKDAKEDDDNNDRTEDEKVQAGGEEFAHLSKKEIERRKWLAELDKQREEQRLKKQREKEQDRAGVHDQWADRFVYHKSVEHTSPRHAQHGVSPRQEASVLGRRADKPAETAAPPAAMRSSMVVGDGTLNENRYENKKAEEKRQWLQELERQREEQRLAKVAQKERDRQDEGTWADRYPSDHNKLLRNNEHQVPEKPAPSPQGQVTQRISSAPDLNQQSVGDSEEVTTFLRGQRVHLDSVTKREQEEKRKVYLDYQAQVKAQIEAKERQKREERERKIREEIEEERKLQKERDMMQHQSEMELKKNREREELRQKQMDVLKTAMEEAHERAQEEKNLRRIHHLTEKGHNVSHLKATYDAHSPRVKEYELSAIPGLGGRDSSRDRQSHHAPPASPPPAVESAAGPGHRQEVSKEKPVIGQSYTKDAYVEDRVLTPSRFRNLSKPWDDPDSPRREFGTQTLELQELQAILKSLPDEIQIEYKMKVEEALREKERERRGPARKIHVKSAGDGEPKGARKVRDGNPRLPRKTAEKILEEEEKKPKNRGERPGWNQNKKKKVLKNSEKDPFYNQRREEKEIRKTKRERQLQYLQELNKGWIPSLSKSPTRSRDVSPEAVKPVAERSRKAAPIQKVPGNKKLDKADAASKRDASPNILSLLQDEGHRQGVTVGRSSPPVPTVRHGTGNRDDLDRDAFQFTNNYLRNSQTESKYGDVNISSAAGGDFLPFMRTTEILDPSKAEEPVAISRENSRMERARRAYFENLHPANKGKKLDIYQDREREAAFRDSKNPLINPGLVTDHPTGRQDMILQQLSSLKQTLMQRQKELETYMTPEEMEQTSRS